MWLGARNNPPPDRAECPLWVNSRHSVSPRLCPLYPRKRTSSDATRRACRLCAHSDVYAPQQSGLSPDTVRSTIGFSVRCTADVSASSPLYRFDRPGGGATPRRPKKLIEPANKL